MSKNRVALDRLVKRAGEAVLTFTEHYEDFEGCSAREGAAEAELDKDVRRKWAAGKGKRQARAAPSAGRRERLLDALKKEVKRMLAVREELHAYRQGDRVDAHKREQAEEWMQKITDAHHIYLRNVKASKARQGGDGEPADAKDVAAWLEESAEGVLALCARVAADAEAAEKQAKGRREKKALRERESAAQKYLQFHMHRVEALSTLLEEEEVTADQVNDVRDMVETLFSHGGRVPEGWAREEDEGQYAALIPEDFCVAEHAEGCAEARRQQAVEEAAAEEAREERHRQAARDDEAKRQQAEAEAAEAEAEAEAAAAAAPPPPPPAPQQPPASSSQPQLPRLLSEDDAPPPPSATTPPALPTDASASSVGTTVGPDGALPSLEELAAARAATPPEDDDPPSPSARSSGGCSGDALLAAAPPADVGDIDDSTLTAWIQHSVAHAAAGEAEGMPVLTAPAEEAAPALPPAGGDAPGIGFFVSIWGDEERERDAGARATTTPVPLGGAGKPPSAGTPGTGGVPATGYSGSSSVFHETPASSSAAEAAAEMAALRDENARLEHELAQYKQKAFEWSACKDVIAHLQYERNVLQSERDSLRRRLRKATHSQVQLGPDADWAKELWDDWPAAAKPSEEWSDVMASFVQQQVAAAMKNATRSVVQSLRGVVPLEGQGAAQRGPPRGSPAAPPQEWYPIGGGAQPPPTQAAPWLPSQGHAHSVPQEQFRADVRYGFAIPPQAGAATGRRAAPYGP
eukprot:TRINITY_DN665_c0_g3_i1.p1 TRINITY_DN665_c0_g3~~TRINITY_DN665_c0_g3_i1.p1  ORF type:complete len:747 (+),score=265.92 TRINITY_DN665_c0_g3_i1:56-2296(+)